MRVLRVHGGVHGEVHRRGAGAVRGQVDLRALRGRRRRGDGPGADHLARGGARPPRQQRRMVVRSTPSSPMRDGGAAATGGGGGGGIVSSAAGAGASLARTESCFAALVE